MNADLRGLVAELRELAGREDSVGWRQAVMDKAARIELSVAQGQGFVMVPREPTEAMLHAAVYAIATGTARQVALAHYTAMLAAAPAQPDGVSK